jgi:hypothetical protein
MFREAKSLSIRRRDDKHSLRTSGDCLGNDVEPHRATTPLTGKVMAMRAVWLPVLAHTHLRFGPVYENGTIGPQARFIWLRRVAISEAGFRTWQRKSLVLRTPSSKP